MADLKKHFEDMLKDVYYAEKQIYKALPKMIRAASNEDLTAGFEKHREQTQAQIERLERVFVGLSLEAPTDIIMFLLEEHVVQQVLKAIATAGRFQEPGTGIAFVLPVENVIGLESQIARFKEEVREQYF